MRPVRATVTPVYATTADQSRSVDAAAIAAGTPSFLLMQRAANAAVSRIVARHAAGVRAGVLIGPGRNGGDGWLVADGLRRAGWVVRVETLGESRPADAIAARDLAVSHGPFEPLQGDETVLIDALLGTGQRLPLRREVAERTNWLNARRESGAQVIALDLPTGVGEAADGPGYACDAAAVQAHHTISFGSCKRALLSAREHAGTIDVVDIGVTSQASCEGRAARLVDATFVHAALPVIAGDAHKGQRGRLAIIGGAAGMVGAVILAARAALSSGIGLVRCLVQAAHIDAVHSAVPEALVNAWPGSPTAFAELVGEWAHAIVIGPGLGRSAEARSLVALALASDCPLLVDADALRVLPTPWTARRQPTLFTPHPGEAAALLLATDGSVRPAEEVSADRDAVATRLATDYAATVLLKGVPTVVASATATWLVPRGTAALATGGSGDVLSGIAGTLLAQGLDASDAGASSAWVHGLAAERATASVGGVRGTSLATVLSYLPASWPRSADALPPPLLAQLPDVAPA
jgi:ADP-dependent NAD(P)H-hydrate dehydratase / NAD(P)H-hydrate epimerase